MKTWNVLRDLRHKTLKRLFPAKNNSYQQLSGSYPASSEHLPLDMSGNVPVQLQSERQLEDEAEEEEERGRGGGGPQNRLLMSSIQPKTFRVDISFSNLNLKLKSNKQVVLENISGT